MLPSHQKYLKYADETITVIKLIWFVRLMDSGTANAKNTTFLCSCGTFHSIHSFSNACAPLPLSPDSLCTFPGGSPEEQVCVWLWHHQHADGVWQSWAKDEGVWTIPFAWKKAVKEVICVHSCYHCHSRICVFCRTWWRDWTAFFVETAQRVWKVFVSNCCCVLWRWDRTYQKARWITMWQALGNACCAVKNITFVEINVFTGNRQY